MLTTRRIQRATIACALACVLVAPATSSAQHDRAAVATSSLAGTTSPPNLRTEVATSSLAGTTSSRSQNVRAEAATSSLAGTTSSPSQDLRSTDTRDAAVGRGTFSTPDVTVVKLPQPAPVQFNAGIDWRDAGIGAGMLGLAVLGLAGATAILHRRRRGPHTATAA